MILVPVKRLAALRHAADAGFIHKEIRGVQNLHPRKVCVEVHEKRSLKLACLALFGQWQPDFINIMVVEDGKRQTIRDIPTVLWDLPQNPDFGSRILEGPDRGQDSAAQFGRPFVCLNIESPPCGEEHIGHALLADKLEDGVVEGNGILFQAAQTFGFVTNQRNRSRMRCLDAANRVFFAQNIQNRHCRHRMAVAPDKEVDRQAPVAFSQFNEVSGQCVLQAQLVLERQPGVRIEVRQHLGGNP